MDIKKGRLKDVFEITLKPRMDERGFFMRTFDQTIFNESGLNYSWLQENHSRSEKKGIIRGLHFQLPPYSETKLVRCINGIILDVFVDLRPDSPDFGKWSSIELSAENKKMILIPRGFAHGFCTISEISEVVYKVDNVYSKEHERGILWKDADLNIEWPCNNPLLSEKDKNNISFKEFLTSGESSRLINLLKI